MKNLIYSIICLCILFIPWSLYDSYSSCEISSFYETIQSEIIPHVENSNWGAAENRYLELKKEWSSFKDKSDFFLDAESLRITDELIDKTYYHISNKDKSNSNACLSQLSNNLLYLHNNEKLSFQNVF